MSKNVQKLLGMKVVNGKLTKTRQSEVVKEVRKEFAKLGPVKAKQAIIQEVAKGISPVFGKGKFKKYSPSYKLAIKGEAFLGEDGEWVIFRTNKRGKRYPVRVDSKKLKGNNPLQDRAIGTKMVSPVNLRLSGELTRSLIASTSGGYSSPFRLILVWKHYLAEIHNDRGAGKSKVIRRMLPTKAGEKFNRRITLVIFNELKKSTDRVVKRYT